MRNNSFKANITPLGKADYLGKLFLRKMSCNDPLNGCPNECHVYIPVPTEKFPDINIQIWFRNGAGKNQMRFKDPVTLATWLRKIADQVTSDECLDIWQRLEDECSQG